MKEQKRAREEERMIERERDLAACLFNSRLSGIDKNNDDVGGLSEEGCWWS
jgi:hypothetical protein